MDCHDEGSSRGDTLVVFTAKRAPRRTSRLATTEPVTEDIVVAAREVAALRQPCQPSGRLVRERHLARPPRLRRARLDGAAYRTSHHELATLEVDVAPAQRN
jgi:hypothetical protein